MIRRILAMFLLLLPALPVRATPVEPPLPDFPSTGCEICQGKVQKSFLGKILGTVVKDKSAKAHTICFECQKKFTKKEDILAQIK